MFDFHIFEMTIVDTSIKIHFIRELYLNDNLLIKIFIDIDIIIFEKIIINVRKQIVIIDNYEITTKLHVIFRDYRVNRIVRLLKQLIIFSHIQIIVSIKIREQTLLSNRDYSFHSQKNNRLKTENDFFFILSTSV